MRYSLAYKSPISYLRVALYIYRNSYYSVNLFFNPLKRLLPRFSAGYILIAALTFRLRFGYKAIAYTDNKA